MHQRKAETEMKPKWRQRKGKRKDGQQKKEKEKTKEKMDSKGNRIRQYEFEKIRDSTVTHFICKWHHNA